MSFEPIDDASFEDALLLNNAHDEEVGAGTPERFRALLGWSRLALWAPDRAGFVIIIGPGQSYDSFNYRWFSERCPRFSYLDRVVVRAEARGKGVGRALYERVFADARGAGFPFVGLEVNVDPPNPASDAFHAALGFQSIDVVLNPFSGKTVRYMNRAVEPS
jgi:predicted GNAT superfamily acetyltransferase